MPTIFADAESTLIVYAGILLFIGMLFGIVGHSLSGGRTAGFFFGFLLGPIGLIIAALIKDQRPEPQHQSLTYTSITPTALPTLPEEFHIRRGFGAAAEHYGPYSLADVMAYLEDGTLLPTDLYRTPTGTWSPLEHTGLTA